MMRHNPEMIYFVDVAILWFWIQFFYNMIAMKLLNFNFDGDPLRPGKFLKCINYCGYIILIIRIALASYGIHFSWTDEQIDMRMSTNKDEEVREAARAVASGVDALIWLSGLLDVVIIGLSILIILLCFVSRGQSIQ